MDILLAQPLFAVQERSRLEETIIYRDVRTGTEVVSSSTFSTRIVIRSKWGRTVWGVWEPIDEESRTPTSCKDGSGQHKIYSDPTTGELFLK